MSYVDFEYYQTKYGGSLFETITIAGDGSFTWAHKVSALALDEDYPVS